MKHKIFKTFQIYSKFTTVFPTQTIFLALQFHPILNIRRTKKLVSVNLRLFHIDTALAQTVQNGFHVIRTPRTNIRGKHIPIIEQNRVGIAWWQNTPYEKLVFLRSLKSPYPKPRFYTTMVSKHKIFIWNHMIQRNIMLIVLI